MIGSALRSGLSAAVLALLPIAVGAQSAERARYEADCAGGAAGACVMAGLLYEAAPADARDLPRAADLYRRACDSGEPRGCASLALMYENGTGVRRNLETAVGLFRSACGAGEAAACDRVRSLEQMGQVAPSGPSRTSGRVVDARSRSVLGNAIVDVPALGAQAITDAAGRFELPDLPPGRHTVRAQRVGYEPLERDLAVPGTPDLLLLLVEAEVPDPDAPGRVVGRVTEDGQDRAIAGVDVAVVGQSGARTLSNNQGRFTIRDVAPGLVRVHFEHLGFASRTATLILQPGRTVEVAATLATQAIELEPIQVMVRNSFLVDKGFYRRTARGVGSHFDRQDLDRIDPFEVSDLLWRVPGVRVRYDVNAAYATGRRGCIMPIYVDDVRWPVSDINDLPPEWVEAVEIYHAVGMPVQYSMGNDCGVVLIWTRR